MTLNKRRLVAKIVLWTVGIVVGGGLALGLLDIIASAVGGNGNAQDALAVIGIVLSLAIVCFLCVWAADTLQGDDIV
jgi:hypothetical protein